MGNQESRQGAIEQAQHMAEHLKELGDELGTNLGEGLSELKEGAICTAATTGVDSLDCCNDRGSASKLSHRFDLPDDAQARPVGQRNQAPKEKKLGKKKHVADNDDFASRNTLAGPGTASKYSIVGNGNNHQSNSSQAPPQQPSYREDQYGLGILWLTRNSKLICAGFAPGSPAREAGVKSGDILKAVDGVDILQMKVDGKTGKHAAGELMLGVQNSECNLQLLRVQQTLGEDGKPATNDPSAVKLTEIKVCVPRLLKAESFSTQHF